MKKIFLFFLPLVLLSGAAWFGYDYYYGGKEYYTQIISPGEVSTGNFSTGETYTQYNYTQNTFNAKGEKSVQTMKEIRDQPLRINAYLKLKVNPRKGVLSWEEISKDEVPEKALENLAH